MATSNENTSGNQLSHEQIITLSKNMYDKLHIKDGTDVRKLDPSKDTRSAYFHKADIDALFAAHPGSNGLKVYFGVHDSSLVPLKDPSHHNKLMAALVPTTDEVEHVAKPAAATLTEGVAAPQSFGLQGTKICPPDTNCA